MREVALGGKTLSEKICRSKSTNQSTSGERNERLPDLCFSICRFSQVVFFPRAQPHAQSLFLFPIVFGISLIHFFNEKKDGATGNSIVCLAASIPSHAIWQCEFYDEWKLFRRVQCFCQRKVWTQRHSREEKLHVRCTFLARKSAKLIANFSAKMVASLPSFSLCIIGSAEALHIVREVHSVREREREKDGSDVTIVALKLAMSFTLFLAKNVHLSTCIGEEFCAFPSQKICASVSPLLNSAEFTLSVAKNVAPFETVRILRTVKWRDWQPIEAAK